MSHDLDGTALGTEWMGAQSAAIEAFERLNQSHSAVESAPWWSRIILARREREDSLAAKDAIDRLSLASQRLRHSGVGAGRNWTTLSRIVHAPEELSLEATLERCETDLPRGWLTATRSNLPAIRARTALGSSTELDGLHQQLLDISQRVDTDIAAILQEHLPGWMRSIPTAAATLERCTPFYTIFVAERLAKNGHAVPPDSVPRQIVLHDIVVHEQGRGLGSALLQHLCTYADATGCEIVGVLEPGPGKPSEDAARLAGWYARYGFTQGDQAPEAWVRGTWMSRRPN